MISSVIVSFQDSDRAELNSRHHLEKGMTFHFLGWIEEVQQGDVAKGNPHATSIHFELEVLCLPLGKCFCNFRD